MTIYSKGSVERKNKYHIVTSIEEYNGKKIVRKFPANPLSQKHLISLLDKYKKVESYFKIIKVAKPTLTNRGLVFPFIDGKNLLDEFISYYIDGNNEKAHVVLEEYKKILNNLPSVRINVGENDQFKTIFGNTKSKYECVELGCLDLNLDNFIRKGKDIFLIDYEWVYDTPIPKSYLYFRTLLYSFLNLREFLEYKVSEEYPMVRLRPTDILIPKLIYDHEFPKFDDQVKFFEYEMNFQKFVGLPGIFQKLGRPLVLTEPTIVNTFDKIENCDMLIEKKEKEIKKVYSELDNIYNSRSWKMITKLKKIKKSTPFTKKL